jgi:hypothetical protein
MWADTCSLRIAGKLWSSPESSVGGGPWRFADPMIGDDNLSIRSSFDAKISRNYESQVTLSPWNLTSCQPGQSCSQSWSIEPMPCQRLASLSVIRLAHVSQGDRGQIAGKPLSPCHSHLGRTHCLGTQNKERRKHMAAKTAPRSFGRFSEGQRSSLARPQ